MTLNNTPWQPVQAATLSWRDSTTPFSEPFSDVYYSLEDGLAESRHVFLDGNELPERWQSQETKPFCVAETGFGTGLNFLATYAAWRNSPAPRQHLHYFAVEQHPLAPSDLQRALKNWPSLAEEANELLALYPGLLPGRHRLHLADGAVCLDLWWTSAQNAFDELASTGPPVIDAWYLDGFAPATNPAMWTRSLFVSMASLSNEGASFSTFTAAGQVRRDLEFAGFEVTKRPGYGRKRESLHGVLGRGKSRIDKQTNQTNWDLPVTRQKRPEHVLVLGAGLAGAHAAAALAARNVQVTVVERGAIASGASTNQQGVLYTRVPAEHSELSDFALTAFAHATALYQSMIASNQLDTPQDGQLCGAFLQSRKREEFERLQNVLRTIPEFAQALSPEQAAAHLGVTPGEHGLWHPKSGWLRPPRVCAALLDHPLISVRENVGEVDLRQQAKGWSAFAGDECIAHASCAIVAAGLDSTRQEPLNWLPVQAVRGQTTDLPATDQSRQLRAVLCHHGYIAPATSQTHCIGATFEPGEHQTDIRPQDHASNLGQLAEAVREWRPWLSQLDPQSLQGTARLRCASNDYLPVVGQVPHRAAFIDQYAALRKNAKLTMTDPGPYLDGLFVTTAHGSRGLTSTPLAAQLLASEICEELGPLPRNLSRALSPARFIIRDLIRNRC